MVDPESDTGETPFSTGPTISELVEVYFGRTAPIRTASRFALRVFSLLRRGQLGRTTEHASLTVETEREELTSGESGTEHAPWIAVEL